MPRLALRAGFYPRWLGSRHLVSTLNPAHPGDPLVSSVKSPLGTTGSSQSNVLLGSRADSYQGMNGSPLPEAVHAAGAPSLPAPFACLSTRHRPHPASRPKPTLGSSEAVPLPNTLDLEFPLTLPTCLLGPSLNVTPPLSGRPQRDQPPVCQSVVGLLTPLGERPGT